MNVIEILEFEHQMILDVLGVAQARLPAITGNVPVSKEPGIADFCAKFISRCHHAKEFEIFVKLLQKDRAYVVEPITLFRAEHSQLCQLTSSLAVAWKLMAAGQSDSGRIMTEYFNNYADRMRDHCQKESRFYQVVSDVLDDADQLALKEAFDRLDCEMLGTEGHDRYCRWSYEFARADPRATPAFNPIAAQTIPSVPHGDYENSADRSGARACSASHATATAPESSESP